jgi:hypothetical protein
LIVITVIVAVGLRTSGDVEPIIAIITVTVIIIDAEVPGVEDD